MMLIDRDLIPALVVLALPALLALWVRRPRRVPPGPVRPTPGAYGRPDRPLGWVDHRTPEQRAADQARTNDAWGLR